MHLLGREEKLDLYLICGVPLGGFPYVLFPAGSGGAVGEEEGREKEGGEES